jgi:predicted amidohydrolase YtcJ
MTTRLELPLAFDHHTHVSLYASLRGCPDLAGLDRAAAFATLEALPRDRLTLVLGWHSARLPLAPADLEALPPAVIVNASLHGFRLTGAGRAMLRERDPELADRHADAGWSEQNLARVLGLFGSLAGLDEGKLDAFMEGLGALGVGAAEDMLLTGEGAWRAMAASRWAPRLRWWAAVEMLGDLPAEAIASLAGVKLFTDGALGARTAALAEPYLDGTRGTLCRDDDGLAAALVTAHATGKPVAIHAIGGVAIAQALGALERLDREGVRFPSVRIEHAQLMGEAEARRARDLGVVLSMQPNFGADSVDYADRLGPATRAANNPFRMLIDRIGFVPGRDLIFGSDGMPHGIATAIEQALFPAVEGQRLSLEEVVAGYGEAPGGGAVTVEIDERERRVRVGGG